MPSKLTEKGPDDWDARMARREKMAAATDAGIAAYIDALKRGEKDDAAALEMKVAMHDVSPATTPDPIEPDMLPRLKDEGWTVDKQRGFLIHLAESGCVSHACAAVGMSRQAAYQLRHRAPNSIFAIGWDVAIHMARQVLLDEATERAFAGREVPVWYHGERVGQRVVHNDRLLMFLLAQQREPIHPALNPRELTHLFPAMLRMVDKILPPAFSAERIAELTDGQGLGRPDFST